MKYIIDLDGTLLNGETANLDSVSFMAHLNATHADYLVMTNSIKSPTKIWENLEKVGISIEVNRIMNPINASNIYLKQKVYQNTFVLGSQLEIDQLDVAVNNANPDIILLIDFEKSNVCYN